MRIPLTPSSRPGKTISTLVVAIVLGWWLHGVFGQATLNDDMRLTDQDAYVDFTIKAKESAYTFTGSRNRMPLYPWLQALFCDLDMSKEALFERGKRVNVVLTLVVLLVVFAVFLWYLPTWHAFLVTAITAFTVFAYKAPYFQADVLYYCFGFVAFVLSFEVVQRRSWKLAAAAGCIAALAHLTKASATPLVILTAGCLAVSAVLDLSTGHGRTRAARAAAALLVLSATFLLTLSPYLVESKRNYGAYFYNVNSTSYIWADSWQEAKRWTPVRNDERGRPQVSHDVRSGLRHYFETHGAAEVGSRLYRGAWAHYANLVHYRVAEYFLVFLVALLTVAAANVRYLVTRLGGREKLPTTLFVTGYFLGYGLLYAFYAAIASGPRFILALVLPAFFVCTRVTSRSWLERLPWAGLHGLVERSQAARATAFAVVAAFAVLFVWELLVRFPAEIGHFPASE